MHALSVEKIMAAERAERLANSPQLTLGKLIDKIKAIGVLQEDGSPKNIHYDFGTAIPTQLDSWRGSYEELAIGYTLCGYDVKDRVEQVPADYFLKMLKGAVGSSYTGWKGGYFKMHRKTPVWVDNPGNFSETAVVDVKSNNYQIIIITQYCEY